MTRNQNNRLDFVKTIFQNGYVRNQFRLTHLNLKIRVWNCFDIIHAAVKLELGHRKDINAKKMILTIKLYGIIQNHDLEYS